MNDDQLLLANAYLDDELDAPDRARAEADAEVMDEVGRLQDVRAAVRAVDQPAPGRREQAIAAALTAFADAERATDAATVPVPLASRRRRRWMGPVAAAAAAVVVVAGAVAVLGNGSGGGDDDSAASEATEEVTLLAEDGRSAAATAPADQDATADAGASEANEGEATADTLAPAAGAPAAAGTAPLAPAAPATDLGAVLDTPDELVDFGRRAGDDSTEGSAPSTCPQPGTYRGPAVYDGVPVEVFLDGEVVVAVDATSCEVVERVQP